MNDTKCLARCLETFYHNLNEWRPFDPQKKIDTLAEGQLTLRVRPDLQAIPLAHCDGFRFEVLWLINYDGLFSGRADNTVSAAHAFTGFTQDRGEEPKQFLAIPYNGITNDHRRNLPGMQKSSDRTTMAKKLEAHRQLYKLFMERLAFIINKKNLEFRINWRAYITQNWSAGVQNELVERKYENIDTWRHVWSRLGELWPAILCLTVPLFMEFAATISRQRGRDGSLEQLAMYLRKCLQNNSLSHLASSDVGNVLASAARIVLCNRFKVVLWLHDGRPFIPHTIFNKARKEIHKSMWK
jgi:hypothetical protein